MNCLILIILLFTYMEKSKWETLNASWLFIRYVNNTIKKVLIIKIRNFLATQKAKKKMIQLFISSSLVCFHFLFSLLFNLPFNHLIFVLNLFMIVIIIINQRFTQCAILWLKLSLRRKKPKKLHFVGLLCGTLWYSAVTLLLRRGHISIVIPLIPLIKNR